MINYFNRIEDHVKLHIKIVLPCDVYRSFYSFKTPTSHSMVTPTPIASLRPPTDTYASPRKCRSPYIVRRTRLTLEYRWRTVVVVVIVCGMHTHTHTRTHTYTRTHTHSMESVCQTIVILLLLLLIQSVARTEQTHPSKNG